MEAPLTSQPLPPAGEVPAGGGGSNNLGAPRPHIFCEGATFCYDDVWDSKNMMFFAVTIPTAISLTIAYSIWFRRNHPVELIAFFAAVFLIVSGGYVAWTIFMWEGAMHHYRDPPNS